MTKFTHGAWMVIVTIPILVWLLSRTRKAYGHEIAALKAFGYTLVVSAISVVIGITLANTIRPGERVSAATAAAA